MEKEESYIVSKNELLDFAEKCTSSMDKMLHITTQELAEKFILICSNFREASILNFHYETGNNSPMRLCKYKNNLFITIGLHIFSPYTRRYGETFFEQIIFCFEDISEITYIPVGINTDNEIELVTFAVSEEGCIFSCVLKSDHSKKISIKSKRITVEDFITDYDDEDENNNMQKLPGNKLSTFEQAYLLFKQKQYQSCIDLLENDYDELEENAGANNLLANCYSCLKNNNEAIYYNDKVIKISKKPVYYYNRGCYFSKCGLYIDTIKCFNQALKLSDDDEKEFRFLTKEIINFVSIRTRFFSNYDLTDNDTLKEFILYFDSIIDLPYCFPELREKYKKLKNDAIEYYYNETKSKGERLSPFADYEELASRCSALLQIKNLKPEQKQKIEKLLNFYKTSSNSESSNLKSAIECGGLVDDDFDDYSDFDDDLDDDFDKDFNDGLDDDLNDVFNDSW